MCVCTHTHTFTFTQWYPIKIIFKLLAYRYFGSLCFCARVCSDVSDFLRPHGLLPARLLSPWDFPGKSTGVSCHFLLQGIFLTQGSNACLLRLLHWQADLYQCATWEAQYRHLGSTDHQLDQNNHNLLAAYYTVLDFMHSLWCRLWGNTKMFKVAALDWKFHED